ncbi:MAG: hypothetical protein JKY81_06905 [Colwellia sp.]|nr:hypothetical protein [Colwellia sp.]
MFCSNFTVHTFKRTAISLTLLLALASCTATNNQYVIKKSPLSNNQSETKKEQIAQAEEQVAIATSKLEILKGLPVVANRKKASAVDEMNFSNKTEITAAAQTMALVDFIHHSLGDVLGANYVVSDEIKNLTKKITLNIQGNISKRQYYLHVKEILKNNNAYISFKNNVYYLYPLTAKNGSQVAIGIGREIKNIPATSGKILQIIPLQFGIRISIERTLNQLTKATITPDFDQGTIFVQGNRAQIRQVIELVDLLDRPANRAKQIGFLTLSFISPEYFVKQVVILLENEGIPAGAGKPNQKNVVLVPLTRTGGVAIFASSKAFLTRVEQWGQKLDQPPKGTENQFFIYHPQYARARDLGDSLMPLFGGEKRIPKGNSSRDTKSAIANKRSTNRSVSNGDFKMVVDERANMVIFETSGTRYQSLLPLIKRLDVMPRQVLLEMTIAEVTLTDEFKQGVEFGIQDGSFNFSTQGALGVVDIVGGSLSWAGSLNTVNFKAIQDNSLVNILSNPTLLVRDGTTATIVVGDEIPVITSSNDNRNTDVVTTNVERRQTGLTLTVTPTINTEGVVIMEIEQKISNALDAKANSDALIILNREIKTEVVANSGQTIILGGLISETKTNGDSKVPFLGDIPILGNLFKSKSETKKKTELVILVTPKIIFDEKQWDEIKKNFVLGLDNVSF